MHPVDGAEHLVKGKMPSGGAEQKTDAGTFVEMNVIMLLVYVVELCGWNLQRNTILLSHTHNLPLNKVRTINCKVKSQ